MNRRRFLKYAGATAAAVGASALGLNYISQQSPSTSSPTASTMSTARELTTTSSSLSSSLSSSTEAIQLASLQGRLFFDYNGNGKQDGEEPAVVGALVQLKDDTAKVIAETLTNSSGDYQLEDVRSGSYRLHIGVEHFSDKKFRYMCRSTEELTAIPEGYSVLLDRTQSINIGLMEGYLTLPFAKGTRETHPRVYVDVDPRNAMRDWHGGASTYNGHLGTDFSLAVGTKVLAAGPGFVSGSYYDGNDGNCVAIRHYESKLTIYCHLKERIVSYGDMVSRGDAIALSGHTGKLSGPTPHLHFQFGGYGSSRIDPYRNLRDSSSLGYWTKDNDPQYPF